MSEYGIVNYGKSSFEIQANGRKVAVFEQFEDAQMFVAMHETLTHLRTEFQSLLEIASMTGQSIDTQASAFEKLVAEIDQALAGGWMEVQP